MLCEICKERPAVPGTLYDILHTEHYDPARLNRYVCLCEECSVDFSVDDLESSECPE